MFTDFDGPSNQTDYAMSLQRAKDLEELDVDVELFPLPCFNQVRPIFDVNKFYSSLITYDEEDIASGVLDINASL